MFEVLSTALPNGLQIYINRIPDSGTVACGLWFNQGSMHESDETNGLSHFIEHLMFNPENGNEGFKDKFKEAINMGVVYNASTTKEYTSYYCIGLKSTIDVCLELLQKIALCRGVFAEDFINNEKKVVLQEATSFYSSFNQIKERMGQALWGNMDVGRIIMGNVKNVEAVNAEALYNIINESYTSENVNLVISGDVEYKEVLKKVEDIFSVWQRKDTRKYFSVVDAEPGIYFNNGGSTNSVVSLGFRLGNIDNNKQTAVNTITGILGASGMDSLMVREIRQNRGLAYTVGAFNSMYSKRGNLGLTAVVENSKVKETVNIMTSILKEIKNKGFSNDEIEKQKKVLETNKLLLFSDQIMRFKELGSKIIFGKNCILENDIYCIRKMTNDDLMEAFNEIFVEENMGFAAIGHFDIDDVVNSICLE